MNEICFATGNKNKLREVKNLLTNYKLVSLDDLNFSEDIAETENTIQGNAELKASFIYNKYNIDCFSDDTGLFIDSLGGLPGVKSARYAGENCNSEENIKINYETDFKICLKESGSFIAISAKTFLFKLILDFFNLPINSEYDIPPSLTAALILCIHKLLISLFLVRLCI